MNENRTDQELNRIIAIWAGKHPTVLPPNYCGSLDAVHEAEESLSTAEEPCSLESQAQRYATYLFLLPEKPGWRSMRPTARQRAEALVKVIEEGKR